MLEDLNHQEIQEPPPLLRVARWAERYEVNRSRELKNLAWLALPTDLASDSYVELLDHPNGAAHWGCWTTILMAAARSTPRGTLLRDGGRPHTARTLATLTRMPESIVVELLRRAIALSLLEIVPPTQGDATIPQEGAGFSQDGATIPQGPAASRACATEQNKTKQEITSAAGAADASEDSDVDELDLFGEEQTAPAVEAARELVALWNELAAPELPRVLKASPKRLAAIRRRLEEHPDLADWRAGIEFINRSPFHLGKNDRGWRASFEFILQPDRLTRLLEQAAAPARGLGSPGALENFDLGDETAGGWRNN